MSSIEIKMSRTAVQGVTVFEDDQREFSAKVSKNSGGGYYFVVKFCGQVMDQGNAATAVDARRIIQGYYDSVVESYPTN